MNRQNGFDTFRSNFKPSVNHRLSFQKALYVLEVEVESILLYIDKDGVSASIENRTGSGKEGERHGEHLVSRTDPQCFQRKPQRVGTAGNSGGVLCTQVSSHLPLQSLHLGAQNKVP